jgi:HlyD family secretion protein
MKSVAALAAAAAAAEKARAALAAATTNPALHTANAPFDATVLQVNIRPGEFVQAGPRTTPLVVLGLLDRLRVRAEIEEADLPRFNPHARASASPRGGAEQQFALSPLRVDPLVVPKTALTGAAAERVDTRVLRVLYEIESDGAALYPGQQMDVFITSDGAKKTANIESDAARR